MSKEKQIEEMVKALNEATFGVNTHTLADHLKPETINKVAEYLYNAGYRKQSEVAKEIFEKIDIITMRYLDDKDYTTGEMVYDLDNFKHEYMKGGEG